MEKQKLLTCPIRGQLTAATLAKDGMTTTEEARRIDFLKFLLKRRYPKNQISVETVILKNLGESGRNKLRADVIVYDESVHTIATLSSEEQLNHAILVAEIKRDSAKKASGISCQLKPAMSQLPGLKLIGVYWDDVNRLLFVKKLVKKRTDDFVEIVEDSLEHLPSYGSAYKSKPITVSQLSSPDNLVATLFSIANVMRSQGVNDEHLRYKETVKLILARYCDERAAAASRSKELGLQVLPGLDVTFRNRVDKIYATAAKRYSKAKSLFHPTAGSELPDRTLRDIVKAVQGIAFAEAGNEIMQQVFLSFVPAVFKKNLDQFFTPLTLIEAMVEFVDIGPNDKIADPAMGTGDFLTAAMEVRARQGDADIIQRVFGMDVDPKAFELAVINMILNKDGQSNLAQGDSIQDHSRWNGEIDVALCNPPFGEKSLENRANVLQSYDLGHLWTFDANRKKWNKTETILDSQQLGILFIERCFKLLAPGGRMAIILPEGYLCTGSYGYVRQWILENMRLVTLVELPRRIFLKSSADLRSNVVVAQKVAKEGLRQLVRSNYPIQAELVRKVGYKLGAGFSPSVKRQPETGEEIRDEDNHPLLDTDFTGIRERFRHFTVQSKWNASSGAHNAKYTGFKGGRVNEILTHPLLDMKPRRLTPNALENKRKLSAGPHVKLGEIAEIVTDFFDVMSDEGQAHLWRLVEGMDIRANEGVVIPQYPARHWQMAERKGAALFRLRQHDIIVGLVRPERRNIGMLLHTGEDIVGSPDGIAVVRIKPEFQEKYPQRWLFAELRSERSRLQLWTESGGTSYGKLTNTHISDLVIATPPNGEISAVAGRVADWVSSFTSALDVWSSIGSSDDRRPIMNSAIIGLEVGEDANES